jgi:Leucine-rich repeat (LRR) protein
MYLLKTSSGITCFSSPEQRAMFHEKGITDMTGIQDFTSIKFLSLYGNPITSIDVSSLANLSYIDLGKYKYFFS